MRKIYILLFSMLAVMMAMGGCKGKDSPATPGEATAVVHDEIEIKGDSMIYGLSCDGTSDSVVVIWPFSGDPLTLNTIDAKAQGRIIGKPQIGDWIGVMRNPADSSEATMVINLDQLKGTWTYPVLPVMKDLQSMSLRMQKRMMAAVHDSIKQEYFIPREYGFTLKRGHQATPVGRIMRSHSLEDDSPVVYPEVKNYKGWHMLNGRLILVSGSIVLPGMKVQTKNEPDVLDTLDFVSMDDDSLVLVNKGIRYGFHRKLNASEANAEAMKAQARHDSKK